MAKTRAGRWSFHLFSETRMAIVPRMLSTAQQASFRRLFDEIGTVDQVGIEERVAKFTTRSIKKS